MSRKSGYRFCEKGRAQTKAAHRALTADASAPTCSGEPPGKIAARRRLTKTATRQCFSKCVLHDQDPLQAFAIERKLGTPIDLIHLILPCPDMLCLDPHSLGLDARGCLTARFT